MLAFRTLEKCRFDSDQYSNSQRVFLVSPKLIIYANGHFLSRLQNDYSTDANTIGFLATASAGGEAADIAYSNLKVYVLS